MSAFIKDAVDVGLRKKMSNAELIAAFPQYNAKSLVRVANRKRKERGIQVDRFTTGPGIKLPKHIQERLTDEAKTRDPGGNANTLVLKILAVLVTDNLFDAVLGDLA